MRHGDMPDSNSDRRSSTMSAIFGILELCHSTVKICSKELSSPSVLLLIYRSNLTRAICDLEHKLLHDPSHD